MSKLSKNKGIKLMAMIMAVVMILSATLIQTYAATSASTTVAGYSVRATISKPASSYFKVRAESGERMIHDMTVYGIYKRSATGETTAQTANTAYNGWDVSHNFYGPTSYDIAQSATATVTSTYNGVSGSVTVNFS